MITNVYLELLDNIFILDWIHGQVTCYVGSLDSSCLVRCRTAESGPYYAYLKHRIVSLQTFFSTFDIEKCRGDFSKNEQGPGLCMDRACIGTDPVYGPGLYIDQACIWTGPIYGPTLYRDRPCIIYSVYGPGLYIDRAYIWTGPVYGPTLYIDRAYI